MTINTFDEARTAAAALPGELQTLALDLLGEVQGALAQLAELKAENARLRATLDQLLGMAVTQEQWMVICDALGPPYVPDSELEPSPDPKL